MTEAAAGVDSTVYATSNSRLVLIPFLGPTILQSHTALFWLYICYVTYETLTAHSGFHLPGVNSPEFHDFHHLKYLIYMRPR